MSTAICISIRLATRFFYGMVILLSISFFFCLKAQEKAELPKKIVGKVLYEKLLKTQKEYAEAMALGDSEEVADVCYRLGKRYIGLGDYATAQKWFIRSLRIREPLGPSEDIGKVYIFMTDYLMHQKKYPEAMQNVQKAMANFRAAGTKNGLMRGSLAMANMHDFGLRLKQNHSANYPKFSIDSAFYYYQQAENLALSLNKPYDVANVYFCKGNFLFYNVDTTLAINYLKKANAIYLEEQEGYTIINTSIFLGEVYLALQNLNETKKWLDQAKYIMDTTSKGDYHQQSQLIQAYARLYEQTGNWKEALKYYQQYHELTMNTLDDDREGAVARIKIEYETQKKERQLKEQQKMIIIAVVLGVLALITSINFYWFFQKYKHLSWLNVALVSEQNHRVKNNLQQVTNLLSLQSSRLNDEEAKKAVTETLLRVEAMALVHHRLYDGDRLMEVDLASFIPELTEGVLRSYNFTHFQPEYQLDNIWVHVDQAVPLGLIINELVTNACKYALPFNTVPILKVFCQEKNKQIILTIADNGPGFDYSKKRRTFGLQLIQLFTEHLRGQSGFEEDGTMFRLSFSKQLIQPKKKESLYSQT